MTTLHLHSVHDPANHSSSNISGSWRISSYEYLISALPCIFHLIRIYIFLKAINQEIPASWLERKKRERFQRETRIRTKTLQPKNYVQLSGVSETPSSSEKASRKKKKKDPLRAWKYPGIELMSSSDEDEDSTDVGEEFNDLRSYFQALGFPIMFTDFAVKLPKAAVENRLNGCLPIPLWMKIFSPLLKCMPTSYV